MQMSLMWLNTVSVSVPYVKDLTFNNFPAFNESALQEVGYNNAILYFDGRSRHNR